MNIIVTVVILILVVFLIYTLKSSVNDSLINIDNTTKCHPIKDNFDFWCKKMFGGNWGFYEKINGSSCSDEQTKARCKKNWSDGDRKS